MKPTDGLPLAEGPVLVLGMGHSGMAAARLLRAQKRAVTVLDDADRPALARPLTELRALGAGVRVGEDAATLPGDAFALAVVSPGIIPASPWMVQLAARGIPAISELELGWRSCRSRILAVTGSNGKSTLVALCYQALRAAGCDAQAGGNFGDPLSDLVLRHPRSEWMVVEVSSFQMETSPAFHPEVGVWLNLHPTHLDRHGELQRYAALKARMFLNMTASEQAVLFEGAENACALVRHLRCRTTTFGLSLPADVWYHDGKVFWRNEDGKLDGSFSVAGSMFDNPILGPTAAAAVAGLRAAGIDPGHVQSAIDAYQPLPHRMQDAGCIQGVRFINDAKSTNLSAMTAALQRVEGPVRLLAGGRLQQTVDGSWNESLRNREVTVYLWGEAAAVLADQWSAVVPCRVFATMEQALSAAWRDAQAGETVLLSPGCSSHDQFRDYRQRGETFLTALNRIKKGVEK